ncbi:5-carboxymethyl-2-hydroxymuconate semialdehyde dehydrogenase, partial [Paraburkholderia dipogonis]
MTFTPAAAQRAQPLLRHYVDGEFIATATTFPNLSPVDGSVLAHVCEADAATVDA